MGRWRSTRRNTVNGWNDGFGIEAISDSFPHPNQSNAMPTKQQDKQLIDPEKQKNAQRTAAIGKQVIRALGQPDDLHRVQVRALWENHYRVNILVGVDATSATIANSYFLVADSDGNIVLSTPKITKQY